MASRRRLWATITIMLFGLASIVGYTLLSLVTNAQPSMSQYPGWVAVLQPTGTPVTEGIVLEAAADVPGAPGDHPSLVYSVLACGDQPFRGVLLLGGQARLDAIVVTDQHAVIRTNSVTNIPDLALRTAWGDPDLPLGPVQEIPIVIDQPMKCAGPAGSDQQLLALTGTTVKGTVQGAIQRTGNFWGIGGPHTSQVWPFIGGFPTARQGFNGTFTGIKGLQGSFSIPITLHKRIVSGSLTSRAIVDGAVPPLADTSKVVWDSGTPFGATARITNIDDLDRSQSWLIAAGVFFGIGASLLASLLFEWLRPTQEVRPAVPPTSAYLPQSPPSEQEPLPKSAPVPASVVAIVALAVTAYVLRHPRR